jgi:nucleoside phosphorylase
VERVRFWGRRFGTHLIDVSEQALFVNNGHGRLFDAVCQELDTLATAAVDHRDKGYCHYETSTGFLTVYRAPEPAPYCATDLEFLISAGARRILFVNGAGSLRPDLPVGSVLLPGELIREEGTSFHYAAPDVVLRTDAELNERVRAVAQELGVGLSEGAHWTTDAIYRETFGKVARFRQAGVNSVDMELSALAGVAHYRKCALSCLLVVTDVVTRAHTWAGTASNRFREGVAGAARVAAGVFLERETASE